MKATSSQEKGKKVILHKMFARAKAFTLMLRKFATISTDMCTMVKNNKVVVFMKGVPEDPRCGFSNAVVQILRMHGVDYDAHDVLANEFLREGVKQYTEWPTIPQIFINGEFIGGCDILLQMHQNGELIEKLKKVGITSALLQECESQQDASNEEKKLEK